MDLDRQTGVIRINGQLHTDINLHHIANQQISGKISFANSFNKIKTSQKCWKSNTIMTLVDTEYIFSLT